MVENQTECSRLEQRSVIKFLVAANANPMKFMEECVMHSEKHILQKKKFYKYVKEGIATTSVSWKDSQ